MKCVVCRKKPAASGRETCDGCQAAFDRITKGHEEKTTTMSTKKTAAAKGGKKAAAPSKINVRKAAPPAPKSAPAPAEEKAPESVKPKTFPKAAPVEPEADETEDEEGEEETDEDGGETPPPSGGSTEVKSKAHGRSRKTAEKRLSHSIARIEQFPWEAWGVPGIVTALSLLKTGLDFLRAIPKGTRAQGVTVPRIAAGSVVRVKAKHVEKYADLIGEEGTRGLKVEGIRKASAVCVTTAGEKVFFPLREIEVDETPATA